VTDKRYAKKSIRLGGIACAARAIPPNNSNCDVCGDVVQLDLSAVGSGKRRREVQTDEVRMWAAGAGLADSALLEVSASDGTDVLAVFHRLIGQATSSAAVRRLEPLLRRRLSGNSARMSSARAKLRDKTGDNGNGGGQTTTTTTTT